MIGRLLSRMGLDISLVKTTSKILGGNMVSQVFRYVFWFLVVWLVTTEEYGELRYAFVLANFLTLPVVSGFGGAISKFISEHRDSDSVGIYTFHVIIMDLLVLLLVILTTGGLGLVFGEFVPAMTMFFVLILSYYNLYYASVRGLLDIRRMALFGALVNIMRVALLLLMYLLSMSGIYPTVLAYGLPVVIAPAILVLLKERGISLKSEGFDRKIARDIVSFSIPGFTNAFVLMFISQANVIIIKMYYSSFSEVGHYSLAFTIANFIVFIATAITAAQMPTISGLKKDVWKISAYLKKYERMGFVAIFGASLGLALLAPFLFLFLPDDYSHSLPILYALIPGAFFSGMFSIFSATWIGYGKPSESVKVAVFGIPAILVLDILLIPSIGAVGAALAYSVAKGVVLLLMYRRTRAFFMRSP